MPGQIGLDDDELVTRMRRRLIERDITDELLSALERFEDPMWSELVGRIATIETKAISILGWSTALLGLLLLSAPFQPQTDAQGNPLASPLADTLLGFAILAAVVALITATIAARPRRWQWPTVRHWFCEEEFAAPLRLRALHLTELLDTYRLHAGITNDKARALVVSQYAILVAAVLVAVVLLLGLR